MRIAMVGLTAWVVCVFAAHAGSVADGRKAADHAPEARGTVDPARQLRFDWDSIDLTIRHSNAARSGEGPTKDAQTLSLSGEITVLDATHLLGFDRFNNVLVTRILDESGHDVTAALRAPSVNDQRWYEPLMYNQTFDNHSHQWSESLKPPQFSLQLNVDSVLPKRFSRFEGAVRVLICHREEQVDVPFVNNGAAVEVMPGVLTHFVSATHDANSYSYQLVTDGRNDQAPFTGLLRAGETLPERMVVSQYLIDSAGHPVAGHTHAFGNFPTLSNENGSGGGPDSGKIAAIRFVIAIGLAEQTVPFALNDIDLPRLPIPQK